MVEVNPSAVATALQSFAVASAVNQDAPHRFSGGGEKMPTAVPMLRTLRADEAEIGFMHKSGSLQRLPWFFIGQLQGRKPAELVVYQRQQSISRLRVAPANSV